MRLGKKANFAELIQNGENQNGVRTEGSFGVSHGGIGEDYPSGFNYSRNIAGPRWGGSDNPFPMMSESEIGRSLKGDLLKGGK